MPNKPAVCSIAWSRRDGCASRKLRRAADRESDGRSTLGYLKHLQELHELQEGSDYDFLHLPAVPAGAIGRRRLDPTRFR
jgi:hypothetical protein